MKKVKFEIGLFWSYLFGNGTKKIYKTIDGGFTSGLLIYESKKNSLINWPKT